MTGNRIRTWLNIEAGLFVVFALVMIHADPSDGRSVVLVAIGVCVGVCHGLLWRASERRDRVIYEHEHED